MTAQTEIHTQICEVYEFGLKTSQYGQSALQETYNYHFKKQLIHEINLLFK